MAYLKSVEVGFEPGEDVTEALEELKRAEREYEVPASGEFNTKLLTSAMTMDEAYLLVTGYSKENYDDIVITQRKSYAEEEAEHKANIPSLIIKWREAARGIICEEKLTYWDGIVPIRLEDLYRGMELDCTLDLVKMLDVDGCTLEEAEKEFDNQGHSGMSAHLLFGMMKEFCNRGEEFVDYVRR